MTQRNVVLLFLMLTLSVPTAAAKDGSKKPNPLRGSGLVYRNVVTALSMKKDADLTYNPYYAMYLGLAGRWWFGKRVYVGADFGVTRELTEADDTTYSGEWLADDLEIRVGASKFLTIPVLKIDFSADLAGVTPTSKLSQARTLILGLRLGLNASRTFSLLEGLTVSYGLAVLKNFNRYTTSQQEAPLIPGCSSADGFCEVYLNMGDRNPSWRLSHLLDLSLDITAWLGLSGGIGVAISYLYPGVDDERVSYEPVESTDRRYGMMYRLELYGKPIPALGLALGVTTVNPQLKADSTYEQPFVNRYTAIYLDLTIDVEGLVSQLTREE